MHTIKSATELGIKMTSLNTIHTMELNLLRVQHGVGQGGFHTSSFQIHNQDISGALQVSFELVFDCGTISKGPDGRNSKEFITERIDAYQNTGDVVDALFISHLDSDHLNGAATLCNARKVLQIFLPYFRQEEMALFIAQQIISTDQTTLGPAGLADVVNALSGRPLFGVPVTLIGGTTRDGGDAPRDISQPRITLVEIDSAGARRPVGPSVPSGSQLGLQWAAVEIPWTLLPWSYKQSPDGLRQLLVDLPELLKLQTAGAKVTAQDMEKLLALRPRIRTALTKLIKDAGGIESADFNAPSICLYSGPSLEQSRIRGMSYRQRGTDRWNAQCDPIGWITTGDAVLGKYEVPFLQVFSQVLSETGTYVVPHHGAQKNHSRALIYQARGRFALICAKQGNKHHPHSEVLAALTLAGDDHRILTEYITDGVQEHVTMEFNR